MFTEFPNSNDKLKKNNSLRLTRRITAIGMSILVGFTGIDIPALADGSEGGDNIENPGGEGQGENQGGTGQGETQGGAEKTAVAVPALTGWSDGTVANWELVENCNYSVFLYREGEQEAIASAADVTVGSYDFSESFLSAGKYTYKVQAVPTDAISETSKESDLSSEAGYSYAVSVSISQGEHITSVSPASSLLIAGKNGRDSVSISAEADTEGGWVFDSWTGVPEGMTLSNGAESRENTLSIDSSYSGELSVSLTATGKEDPTPVIPVWEVYPSSDVNLTYSGENQVITASLDEKAHDITYTWYKKVGEEFCAIPEATGSELTVRDISDSGIYKVSADYKVTKKTGNVYDGHTDGAAFTVKIVKPAGEGTNVTAALSGTSFKYTGSPVTPAITVTDGDTSETLTEEDYEVAYYNNTSMGSSLDEQGPRAVVTFKRNYTGSITLHFDITKGAYIPVVTIDDYTPGEWIYGNDSKSLSVGNFPDDMTDAEKANYRIYYVSGHKSQEEINNLSTGSVNQPVDAGDYTAFAIVGSSSKYESTHSAPCHFTISPKTITLTAGSGSWVYDGNAHTNPSFSPSKDDADSEFVNSSESFKSIEAVGTITNVGTVANKITYTLSSSTKASNYNIVCVDGVLEVTPTALPSPAGCKWDDTVPGRANWVAVAKNGLTVKYNVTLYEHSEETGVDTVLPVNGQNVNLCESNSIDFADAIHNSADSSADAKSYYFTVQTVSFGGGNKNNYANSAELGESSKLYTATISVDRSYLGVDISDRIERLDLGTYGESVTLIQGESVIIYGKANEGYTLNGFVSSDGSLLVAKDIVRYSMSPESGVSRARLSLSADMEESLPNVRYTANISDTYPTLKSFTAQNKDDLSGVILNAAFYDYLGIDSYRFVPVSRDNISGTYTVLSEDVNWVSLGGERGEVSVSGEVSAPGVYGIQIKDISGNILPPHKGISVYEISFDPGEGEGSMSPIYKAENTAPILPLNKFTKEHYQFKYWSGENTGISVDGAAMVANVNDTLVAQWTSEKVNYTVRYFYMNGNGAYSSEPDEISVYQGNHGDEISVSDSAIQKLRANYTLDTSEGHNGLVSLIPENYSEGIVLDVYYKTGQYSITYTYRRPGATEDTVETQYYYYNQDIEEPEKPVADGYDFVGWEFGGSGVAPETMPANDLYASGTFKAKDTTFKVVYHLETIGNGETKTGIFAVNDDLTRVLKAKTDDSITALLDGEENAGTVVAGTVEGFTLKTVSVSYGAADGESLSEIADTKAGTVKYDPLDTLYINYYYERNVYDLFVDVYKGSRESETNHIFRHTEKHQYQEQLDIDKFSEPDYYLGQSAYGSPAKDDSGNDFSMPQGFVFASYTDYSTGNKPSKMPAGDMSITKDVISNENAEFKLELYFETGTVGEYELKSTLVYDYPIGGNIHVVADKRDDEGNDYFLAYNDFVKTVNNYGYYTHTLITEADANGNLSKEEGVVLDDDSLVLKVYFERRSTTATVSYKYKATGGEETEIASYQVTGKWGTSFAFDPDLLFDNISEAEARNRLAALGSNITTDAEFKNNGLSTDFRNASYLVSYTSHYRYFNANGIVTNTYPSYTFTTIGSGIEADPGYPAKSVKNAGISDTVKSYFSVDDTYNRVTVYYNQISEKEDFYLDVRILNTHLKDSSFDWWTSLDGAKNITKTYDDNTTAVPVLYGYDGDADTDGEEYYQVRVINKCAVVTAATKIGAADGLDGYPAANAKSRSYDYTGIDLNDASNLHPGCIYIGGDYFFYDPSLNTGEKTGAFGNEPVVFKVDSSDRFLQGAYVSYGIGSGTHERAFCDDFLSKYQSEHDEDSGQAELERTALAYDNLSYGGTYVSGDHGYLNVYYYYRENCRLSFYFNGSIYSDQVANSYVYGSVVPKEDVKCDSVEKRTGYDVAWYTDEAYKIPVPDDGLTMDRNRTVYGRYEKSTIRNMEYIYYQLADPITVGENTYNYVNQDNLDDIIAKLESEGKTLSKEESAAQVNVGTSDVPIYKTAKTIKYFLDEAPVFTSIERPTLTYTEITLSKQDADYEEYYLDGYDGFFYNETNTDNRSYGYVNTTPIILKVYFARDQYNVEVLNNVSETDNPEQRKFSIGQHVALASPVKGGYTFDHWNWKKWNGSSYEDFTPVIEAGEEYFKMPGFDLQASAKYVPAAFEQEIVHLFQSEEGSYPSDFIANHTNGDTTASVVFDGVTYDNADIWGTADAPSAIRIVKDGNQLYFGGASVSGGSISVTESNLAAILTTATATSETAFDLDSAAFSDSDFSLFGYSYGLYKDGLSVVRYARGDEDPEAKYGMEIELYYKRSANFSVNLVRLSTDGADSGLTLTGAGMYCFGDTAELSAHLSDGYSFIGWFNADDIEDGLIKAGAHALSTNTEMNVLVRENRNLVALARPNEVVIPKLRFSGKDTYTYGYADSADNTITAIASTTFTSEDDECEGMTSQEIASLNAQAQKTKITGYQWYLVSLNEDGTEDVSIPTDGTTTSSTYRFTTGKNAGAYTYRLKVMFERTDNGRNGFLSKDYVVTVNKAPMSVTGSSYTGTYDNMFHSITFKVNKPAAASDVEIYYHPDTAITAENLNTLEGVTDTLPQYKHVKVDADGDETCHTTYIYIKDKTGNYEDYIGEQDVWIHPKTVSIKATANIFSKMYDGSKSVHGSVTEVGSDLYRLSRGEFYTVQGYVTGDADTEAYILDCNASYNSEHVRDAKVFVVSHMKIVNRVSGDVIHDYIFPDNATLSFTGNITPRRLDIEWINPDETIEVAGETLPYFTYNGEQQGPGIRLSPVQTYAIPSVDADISETLSVSNKQENVGTYSAVATVSVNDSSHYESSDYSFSVTNQKYVIGKRPVVVTPVEKTVTYNGTRQTITNYTAEGLIASHTSTAQSVKSYVDAGSYSDMMMKNLVIKDQRGRIMDDNYEVTYSPATLTIEKCPVRVSGITVSDKTFDGTKEVKSINISGAVFTPLYTNALTGKADKLSLDVSKISAVFTDERAAAGVAADITIAADALKNVGGMDCAKNYVLDVAGSQNSSQADIVKKKLYVIANDKEMKYKIGDENEEVPVFDWRYEGFVDGWGDADTFATKFGIIRSYVCEKNTDNRFVPTIMTVVGEYDIKLENTPVLDNYEVVFVKGVFTVSPSKINITVGNLKNLIAITDKMYDGTTDVLPGQITVSDRENLIADLADQTKGYDKCLLPEDAEYLREHPEVTIITFDFTGSRYTDSKNVGTNKPVHVDYELGDWLSSRYELSDTDKEAFADIYVAPLSITPVDMEISYGDERPEQALFSYTATGLVAGETIENTPDFSGSLVYATETYSDTLGAYSDVNISDGYPITVSGITNGNYDITFNEGKLTVKKSALQLSAPVWSASNIGTVTWTLSSGIGDVTVDKYELKLLKDGETVVTANVSSSDNSYDFADKMHEATGSYTVSVKAIASKDNNAGNKNVDDSVVKTSSSKEVVRLKARFADSVTSGKGAKITIDGLEEDPVYIYYSEDGELHNDLYVIEGERLSFGAVLSVDTGYTATSQIKGTPLASSSHISIANTPSLNEYDGKYVYEGEILVSNEIVDAAEEFELEIGLIKTPARVDGSLTASKDFVTYGFTNEEAPAAMASPKPVVGDNVGLDGYSYTYTWFIEDTENDQFTASGLNEKLTGSDESVYELPSLNDFGKKLESGEGRYKISCLITATRLDNAESATKTLGPVAISVRKASYNPLVRFDEGGELKETVNRSYGESKPDPVVTNAEVFIADIPGEDIKDYITWQYSSVGEAGPWTDYDPYDPLSDSKLYTKAGTYYVRAKIAESSNYLARTTGAVIYKMDKIPLTITGKDLSKEYDGAALTYESSDAVPGDGFTIGGLLTGDTLSALTLSGKITSISQGAGGNTASNTPGNAVIVNPDGEDVTSCYDITYVPGSLTISQRPLTITAGSLTGSDAPIYDGQFHTKADGYGITEGALAPGDSISVSMTEASKIKNAGIVSNDIGAVTIRNASGADVTPSYEIEKISGSLEVLRRDITIAPDNAERAYGEKTKDHTWRVVLGEIQIPGEIAVTVNDSTDIYDPVGSYDGALSITASSPNYNITTESADLTIVRGEQKILAEDIEFIYDGNEHLLKDLESGWSIKKPDGEDLSYICIDESGSEISAEGIKEPGILRVKLSVPESTNFNAAEKIISIRVKEKPAPVQTIPVSDSGNATQGESSFEAVKPVAVPSQSVKTEEIKMDAREESKDETGGGDEAEKTSENSAADAKDPEDAENQSSYGSSLELPENYVGTADGLLIVIGTGDDTEGSEDEKIIDCEVLGADIVRMLDELLTGSEKDRLSDNSRVIFRVEVDKTGPDAEKALAGAGDYTDGHGKIAGSFDSTFFVTIQGEKERKIEEKYSSVRVSFEIPDELKESFGKKGTKILSVTIGEDGMPLIGYIDFDILGDKIVMDMDNYSTYVVVEDERICFIHLIILLLFILSILTIIIYYLRKKSDEKNGEKYNEKTGDKDSYEDDSERRKYRIHLLLVTGFNVVGFILAVFFRHCRWDLPAELLNLICTVLLETIFYNAAKNSNGKKKEAAGTQKNN